MAGSLKLENNSRRIQKGGFIPKKYLSTKCFNQVKFVGFARSDGAADGKRQFGGQWSSRYWKVVRIRCEEFTEVNHEGKEVRFKTLGKEVCGIVNEKGELRVLTRPAKEREQHVSDRMPVTTRRKEQFVKYLNNKFRTIYEEHK